MRSLDLEAETEGEEEKVERIWVKLWRDEEEEELTSLEYNVAQFQFLLNMVVPIIAILERSSFRPKQKKKKKTQQNLHEDDFYWARLGSTIHTIFGLPSDCFLGTQWLLSYTHRTTIIG